VKKFFKEDMMKILVDVDNIIGNLCGDNEDVKKEVIEHFLNIVRRR